MKNCKKILVILTILFIYLLTPKNVYAALQGSVGCSCNSDDGKLKYELTIEYDDTKGGAKYKDFAWSGGSANAEPPEGWPKSSNFHHSVFGNSTGVASIEGKFDPVANNAPNAVSLSCPAGMVVESTRYGSTYYGKFYFYDSNNEQEGKSFAQDINSHRTFDGSHKNFFAQSAPAKAEYVHCAKTTNETNYNTEYSNTSSMKEEVDANGLAASPRENERVDGDTKLDISERKFAGNGKNPNNPNQDTTHQTCESVFGNANDPEQKSVAWILNTLFNYIKLLGIILIVIFTSVDFSKVILSNDPEMMKKITNKLIYRLLAIVALFLLPTLINFLLGLFISGSVTDFTCGIG